MKNEEEKLRLVKELLGSAITSCVKEQPITPKEIVSAKFLNYDLIDYCQRNPWVASGKSKKFDCYISVREKTFDRTVRKLADVLTKIGEELPAPPEPPTENYYLSKKGED